MVNQSQSNNANELLHAIKAPHLFGLVGYGIVLGVFVLAVINVLMPEPNAFLGKIIMPLIFVGLVSLLYHTGQYVHAVHANAIRMLMMAGPPISEEKKH
jgi:uncharacterized membrane protein YczE